MARLYEGSLWRRKKVAPRSVISLRPGPALAHCWERPGTWKRTLSRPGARSVEGSVSSMLGTLLVQRNASAGADVAGAQRFSCSMTSSQRSQDIFCTATGASDFSLYAALVQAYSEGMPSGNTR